MGIVNSVTLRLGRDFLSLSTCDHGDRGPRVIDELKQEDDDGIVKANIVWTISRGRRRIGELGEFASLITTESFSNYGINQCEQMTLSKFHK